MFEPTIDQHRSAPIRILAAQNGFYRKELRPKVGDGMKGKAAYCGALLTETPI
jgi:hypothetical protein